MIDSEQNGPLDPLSLDQVHEIVARRQRQRYRLVQGSLVALVVTGVGFGLRGQLKDAVDTTTPAVSIGDTTEQSEQQTSLPATVPPEADESLEVPVQESSCQLAPSGMQRDAHLLRGHEAFATSPSASVAEAEALAAEWDIPVDEATALVGLSHSQSAVLRADTIDEALEYWNDGAYDVSLGEVADDWQLTTISVKVLNLIGEPNTLAALADC